MTNTKTLNTINEEEEFFKDFAEDISRYIVAIISTLSTKHNTDPCKVIDWMTEAGCWKILNNTRTAISIMHDGRQCIIDMVERVIPK